MPLTKSTIEGLRVRFYFLHHILGAIVVYDQTEVDSFRKMEAWVKELKSFLPNEIPIMIAGNKCDLPHR